METLQEGKEYLRNNFEKGTECPCCGQYVRLYKYAFHSGMSRCLILINQATSPHKNPDGWIHVEDYFVSIGVKMKGYHGKLKYYDMIEQLPNDDTSKAKSGIWRITQKGKDFVNNKILVPKRVHLYNDRVDGWSDEQIDIVTSLGKHFNYNELMNA